MVALHDCNEDVNRAINFLLESTTDTVSICARILVRARQLSTRVVCYNKKILCQNSWETVGKKRSLGKEGGSSETKEAREKKGGEREASRGRGGANRRGRGISRAREGKKSLSSCL